MCRLELHSCCVRDTSRSRACNCRTITARRSSVTRPHRWRRRNGIVRRLRSRMSKACWESHLSGRSWSEATRCFRVGCDFTNSASSATRARRYRVSAKCRGRWVHRDGSSHFNPLCLQVSMMKMRPSCHCNLFKLKMTTLSVEF